MTLIDGWPAGRRELIGRLLFEIVIIFIGVTAAFALEAARQERSDADYRDSMIAAMVPTFDDMQRHNRIFITESAAKIEAFDRDLAAGKRPLLPIYREGGAERPPMRACDGIVASGVSKSLPPELYFELSQFYNRQDSLGQRYVRYAEMTERDIFPLGPDQAGIYDPSTGKLKPQYAAYVDRLRDLLAATRQLDPQARAMKAKVQALY
ncbi:MAG: hypothetical protein ABIW03_06845 [Sphingomicrobium sp.]